MFPLFLYARRNPYSSLRRKVKSSTARDESSVIPSRDWIPPAAVSSQSWSSSVDSELATVGSFDTTTEASLEDKQSFAVFSSVSYDSPEPLVPDTTLQEINEPVFNQNSTLCNFKEPISSIVNSNHFRSDQSSRFEHYNNSRDECSHEKDVPTTKHSESQISNVESQSKNQSYSTPSLVKLSTEQASFKPESEKKLRNQPSFEVEGCVHSNVSVSETGNLSNLTNNSVVEFDGEKPSNYQRFDVAKQKKESPMNNQDVKNDQVTNKEHNMLSEILNFLDDANSNIALTSSPLLAINSETESNAEGGFRKTGCEDVTKLHGMSITDLTEEILALQVVIINSNMNNLFFNYRLQIKHAKIRNFNFF